MINMRKNKKISLSVKKSFHHLPIQLVKDIHSVSSAHGTPGVLQQFMLESVATPHGAKANCYAHFLGMKSGIDKKGMIVHGALTNRNSKSQPGESCSKMNSKTPLQFSMRDRASAQLIDRVLCDNPNKTFFFKPPYVDDILKLRLPRGFHMGCAIVGGQDYHFLRREGINVILRSKLFYPLLSSSVKEQLLAAKEAGQRHVWSHVAGWSGRMKLVDARGKIIVNPAPKKASGQNTALMTLTNKADHHYPSLDYDTFVGFFIVKSRSARVSSRGKPVDIREMKARLKALGVPSNVINARLPGNMRSAAAPLQRNM
jgi:hypothetical protein